MFVINYKQNMFIICKNYFWQRIIVCETSAISVSSIFEIIVIGMELDLCSAVFNKFIKFLLYQLLFLLIYLLRLTRIDYWSL